MKPLYRLGRLLTSSLLAFTAQAQVGERVRLDDVAGLEIDRTEVTIAQFARYVAAVGTVTRAEREGGGFEYVGGWQRRPGWTWQRPEGTEPSSPHLPAVHLTQAEAAAYCRWAGGRPPAAAAWGRAANTALRPHPPAPRVRGRTNPRPPG
ncbi:MAG: SUMF1/EgtB/PvdO family nonheme iron enzyme, partial [Curvibacter sp.]